MSNSNYLSPPEIVDAVVEAGIKKTSLPIRKMLGLGFMAGAFIALAAQGSNIATHTIDSVGIAKLIAGCFFPVGLIWVVICGGELFTGSCLIIVSLLERKSKWKNAAKNLFFVYLANMIGSLLIMLLVYASGQFNYTDGALGGYTIKVAVGKANLGFSQAFFSGVLCNWVVCMAIWLAFAAKDMTGKIWAIFFPILLFVLSGFEHCVTNMYYIPAGMLAMRNADYLNQAKELYHVTESGLANLNLYGFFIKNLLPVTLGNIIGGAVCVGIPNFLIHKYGKASALNTR